MSRRRKHPPLDGRATFGLLCLVGVAAAAHARTPYETLVLPLYGVPVVFGAALFGRRAAIPVTLLVAGVMVGVALLARPTPEGDALVRWLHVVAWGAFTALAAWVAGSLRDRSRRRARELNDTYLTFRDALAQLVLTSSGQADERLCRVADFSVAIAGVMGHDQRSRDEIQAAAMLSAFAATDTSLATITRAAGVTFARDGKRRGTPAITDDDGFLERVGGILSCVRERWDGGGRLGLTGEAIPPGARIVAVASAFETAASAGGLSGHHQAATARLRAGHGSEFDPAVVDAALRAHAAAAAIPRPDIEESVRRAS